MSVIFQSSLYYYNKFDFVDRDSVTLVETGMKKLAPAPSLDRVLNHKPAVKLNHATMLRLQAKQEDNKKTESLKPFVTFLTPKIEKGGMKTTFRPLSTSVNLTAPLKPIQNKTQSGEKSLKPPVDTSFLKRNFGAPVDTSHGNSENIKPKKLGYIPHKGIL